MRNLIPLIILLVSLNGFSAELYTAQVSQHAKDNGFSWKNLREGTVAVISTHGTPLLSQQLYTYGKDSDSLLSRIALNSLFTDLQKNGFALDTAQTLRKGSTGKLSMKAYAEDGVKYLIYYSDVIMKKYVENPWRGKSPISDRNMKGLRERNEKLTPKAIFYQIHFKLELYDCESRKKLFSSFVTFPSNADKTAYMDKKGKGVPRFILRDESKLDDTPVIATDQGVEFKNCDNGVVIGSGMDLARVIREWVK